MSADDMPDYSPRRYAETLRADRAEEALAKREKQLADVLAMADWLDADYAEKAVNGNVIASAIRRAIRGVSRPS